MIDKNKVADALKALSDTIDGAIAAGKDEEGVVKFYELAEATMNDEEKPAFQEGALTLFAMIGKMRFASFKHGRKFEELVNK